MIDKNRPVSLGDVREILTEINRELSEDGVAKLAIMLSHVKWQLLPINSLASVRETFRSTENALKQAAQTLKAEAYLFAEAGEQYATGHQKAHPGLPRKDVFRSNPLTGLPMEEKRQDYRSELRLKQLVLMIEQVLPWTETKTEILPARKASSFNSYVVGAMFPAIYAESFGETFPQTLGGKGTQFVRAALAKMGHNDLTFADGTIIRYVKKWRDVREGKRPNPLNDSQLLM
jgi:hypothetical protein